MTNGFDQISLCVEVCLERFERVRTAILVVARGFGRGEGFWSDLRVLGARLGQLWTAFGGHSADVSGTLGESLVSVEVSLER